MSNSPENVKHDSSDAATHFAGSDDQGGKVARPRVWPLFPACLGVLALVLILQVVVVIAILLLSIAEGQSVQEAAEALRTGMMDAPMFILMIVLSGFSMIAGSFLFGSISAKHRNCSVVERLGLRWPTLSTFSFTCLMLGSIPVLLVAVAVVIWIESFIPGDESLLLLYQNITNGWAIVLIILIGVLPGFGEELFFRGFIQRRMLKRFRPAVAIGITSLIFGLFHVTPHGIALATIIGVWLGVIAWRTNSIWPGALCHAFINSTWNIYQVGRFQWGVPDIPPLWFSVIGGAVVLAAFVWSVRILIRTNHRELATQKI